MKTLLSLFFLLFISTAFSQKKVIDHTAYDGWNTLKSERISNDGNYICYEITPHKGDGFLYIYDVKSGDVDSIPRATRASFSGNSNFLAFKITPGYDTLRNCELEKVDKKKWPKDSMGIYILASDSLIKFDRISSFKVNDESDWITFMSADNKLKMNVSKKKKRRKWCKKKREPEYTSTGKLLTIFNPISGDRMEYKDVKSYEVSKNANQIAYTTHQKVKLDSISLNVVSTSGTIDSWTSNKKHTDLTGLSFNEQETQLVFLSSSDSAEAKVYALKLMDLSSKQLTSVADTSQAFLVDGDAVSTNYNPRFTKDGSYLYFGSAEKPVEEPKDTLIESEKVKLDLWHYQEQRLQPQQLKELKRDKRKTTLYIYDIASANTVQLSDDTLEMRSKYDLKGEYLFATSNQSYAHTYNWVIPYPEDHYRVSIKTGEAELIRVGTEFGGELSPSGEYYTYYNWDKHNHYAIELSTKEEICLTCSVDNVLWEEDINGMPMKAYPSGIIGWHKDEFIVYIQSEFDIWEYNFETNEVRSTTHEEGALSKIEMRPSVWSRDSTYIDFENVYVKGFDRKSKGIHFYNFKQHSGHVDLNEMAYYDAKLYPVRRSKDKSQMMLRKMTAIDYPNLFLADDFKAVKQISDANPQQKDYNWTTVELINWKSYDGFELEGLLYKPENYDPNKEYPLMVYFYELYSDRLHSHYAPRPTASIIFPTEYASADYFVFIPDIRYKEGHPGKSAYDCIMSGTDRVLEMYSNVDSTRMALQGQSWGGYQTAQLVTMTTRYKAAMAGAPVTNMFSAYGGIRWGSGYNRQFQYEHTQSRIGYTIWERPDLYIENSPQFHLPNVETPLLIMHNDGDGAVPWYQGIELYTGLKRLGKTTWMLNYNGEQHNLMKNANRIDLSIRMRQFFDHYLHDKEAPLWLTDGIPATVKGKELRY
ncbi:MAG: S9 family peptidase [Crocinitomicaceae bacterium]|nr:prolyl oligopeptidase family serine peptidase [Flavobacteriales bacterium]NQZ36740.1 S9 family peptidase [Crocinitomicaceae bacterium]